MAQQTLQPTDVTVEAGSTRLAGDLTMAEGAAGIVVFAHGSGSSRFSTRNRFVARCLNEAGLATLQFDLLTPQEEVIDQRTRELRFDIGLLAERLIATVDWVGQQPNVRHLRLGLFGASTGAAAALMAAARRPAQIAAVVSRGGRPDLANEALPDVTAPTLLVVGGDDLPVIDMNRNAARQMNIEPRIEIVTGATHLFEEPGALEEVARLACEWFQKELNRAPA